MRIKLSAIAATLLLAGSIFGCAVSEDTQTDAPTVITEKSAIYGDRAASSFFLDDGSILGNMWDAEGETLLSLEYRPGVGIRIAEGVDLRTATFFVQESDLPFVPDLDWSNDQMNAYSDSIRKVEADKALGYYDEVGCDGMHWLDNTAYRKCCDVHDKCFATHDCTAASWQNDSASWACRACNYTVVGCFYAVTAFGAVDLSPCSIFQDCADDDPY